MKLSRRLLCVGVFSSILTTAIYVYVRYSVTSHDHKVQTSNANTKLKKNFNAIRSGAIKNTKRLVNKEKRVSNKTQHELDFMRLCDVARSYDPNENDRPSILTSKYTLHTIVIVMRHGLRSPLTFTHTSFADDHYISDDEFEYNADHVKKKQTPSCSLNSKLNDQMIINKIGNLMTYVKNISNLYAFPAYPNTTWCQSGQLTAKGARQMYQLGSIFSKKYLNLLRKISERKSEFYIFTRTTNYLRTYQSAMAFLAGFLSFFTDIKSSNKPLNYEKDSHLLHVNILDNVHHCFDNLKSIHNYCNCPSLNDIPKLIKNKINTSMTSFSSYTNLTSAENDLMMKTSKNIIKEVFGSSLTLGNFVEIVESFVCFDRQLPCYTVKNNGDTKGQCLSWDEVGLITKTIQNTETLNALDPVNKITNCLIGYPLLKEIWDVLYNMTMYKRKGELPRPIISLYSGHDKTLEPLLSILQIKRDLWLLPLASALTMELYSLKSKKFFLRVIYNGRDVTKEITFCQKLNGDGLCDLENFNYFMMKNMDDHCFHGDDFSRSCNVKH